MAALDLDRCCRVVRVVRASITNLTMTWTGAFDNLCGGGAVPQGVAIDTYCSPYNILRHKHSGSTKPPNKGQPLTLQRQHNF